MKFVLFPLHTEHTPYLLFSTQHSIRKLPLGASSNEYTDIVIDQKGIVGLDYDYYNNYVYWTDVREEKICRAHIPSPGSDAGISKYKTPVWVLFFLFVCQLENIEEGVLLFG